MAEIDLEALAKCVEALEGPCRETDATIAWLTRWRWDGWDEDDVRIEARSLEYVIERVENGFNSIWRNIPRYTESMDAALTLVGAEDDPIDILEAAIQSARKERDGVYFLPLHIVVAALRARLMEGEGE